MRLGHLILITENTNTSREPMVKRPLWRPNASCPVFREHAGVGAGNRTKASQDPVRELEHFTDRRVPGPGLALTMASASWNPLSAQRASLRPHSTDRELRFGEVKSAAHHHSTTRQI